MRTALIIGSGPAAAATALALAGDGSVAVTVVDLGTELEDERRLARERMSALQPGQWDPDDLRLVARPPAGDGAGRLPEKLSFGSSYPFAEAGQLSPMAVEQGIVGALISGGYGGFSAVWGSQLLPYPRGEMGAWPVSEEDMAPHYRSVLDAVPFAAAEDDLAGPLPLYGLPQPPLPLSSRARAILDRYRRHRTALNRMGLLLGQARTGVRASACVACGLCMTGCPYSLIYSSAHTLDDLRARGRITYHGNLLAVRVEEDTTSATVVTRHRSTGEQHTFTADRVFVACGAIGSARLVLDSLRVYGEDVPVLESAQFLVPFVSSRSAGDPLQQQAHAMSQLSSVLDLPAVAAERIHLQLYTYNPSFVEALPGVVRDGPGRAAMGQLLSRLSVGLGYLPSSVSPRMRLRLNAPASPSLRAPLVVTRDPSSPDARPLMRPIKRALLRIAPHLDLWPIVPRVTLTPLGKSYHWGGSFPHAEPSSRGRFGSDRAGRVAGWRRVHLVDGAVAPSLAATSFTLTIMANAHRIASEALALGEGAS
ncbi:MAG TPA: 4Fe-4S ferredoxin [Candidatus Dormibacteraeota bacterium]|jgi:ferredoxin|nr:4Fe-4S ferredoxin [Candidatus Dormibacteraeota bacterium]